jgi:putative endonuclease
LSEKTANTARGREGEHRAAAALEAAGMRVIAKNIRSPWGEVDIVALDGETVVFVEVKAWSVYGIESLQYGINRKKQRRIIETAKYFLAEHREYNEKAVRFDVVFVGTEAPSGKQSAGPGNSAITHLASAFMERV